MAERTSAHSATSPPTSNRGKRGSLGAGLANKRRSLQGGVWRLAVLAAVQLLLIACDGTDSEGAPRPVLSVEEAREYRGKDVIRVRGSVLIDDQGTARLCSSLAESDPPQCSGPSMLVRRLDPKALPKRSRSGGVTWADRVTLRGTVRGGVLTLIP